MHSWADRPPQKTKQASNPTHNRPFASATPRPSTPSRAIYEVPIVAAAVHRAVPGAEEACMVGRAERALMPSWMDMPGWPGWPDAAFEADAAAAGRPTAAREQSASTLHSSPSLLAASHLCLLVTEGADAVGCAEGLTPRVE